MTPPAESLPVRGAWIEIDNSWRERQASRVSLPVRGAWIEMTHGLQSAIGGRVAPRAGSVD